MTHRTQPLGRRDSARTLLGQRARRALGLPRGLSIHPEHGETALHISLWSPRELQDAYDHAGTGTITAEQVQRTYSDGSTHTITEVTLTARITGVGTVTAATDWDPACPYETAMAELPIIRALASAGAL